MRDVIAAIEIVIHIYFPVAIEIVDAALEKMEIAQLERLYTSGQPTQKIAQRFREIVEVHENKIFPRIHARRHQAILRAIKAADAVKIGRAFQRTVCTVGPAVIRAAKIGDASGRFGGYRGGVMAADVVKGAQRVIGVAYDNN